jgi:hypothetical protein
LWVGSGRRFSVPKGSMDDTYGFKSNLSTLTELRKKFRRRTLHPALGSKSKEDVEDTAK